MHRMLAEILTEKEEEVRRLKSGAKSARKDFPIPPQRDFTGSISRGRGIHLIGEIKFASPSAGKIRKISDPLSLGKIYEKNGASALSLITESRFFRGRLDSLSALKKNLSLPVLRKDFILDEVQVQESHDYGADALLLISRILSRERLKGLLDMTRDLGMAALTEVHDRADIEKAILCGADIIGINNRDLDTFSVDTGITLELAPLIPEECILVSESGIAHGEDIRRLLDLPVRAVLVGTALMKSRDMASKIRELLQAGERIDDQGQDLRDNVA